MELMIDWVACDYEGDLHTNTPDPFNYGPQYNRAPRPGEDPDGFTDDPAWTLTTHTDYGTGELWFYTCPGPHRLVWAGRIDTT
jgi:hypothetical protein